LRPVRWEIHKAQIYSRMPNNGSPFKYFPTSEHNPLLPLSPLPGDKAAQIPLPPASREDTSVDG